MDTMKLKPNSPPARTLGPLPKPKGSAPFSRSKPQPPPVADNPVADEADRLAKLAQQYGCGPIQFSGSPNASYQRHLVFDNVIALQAAGPRERFEALARSVRDVLSQRWVRTEEHYARKESQADLLSLDGVSDRALTR